jgi:chromosome partitioning protein
MSSGEAKKKTRVIAVGNQKGGVGKTTNCIHLAGALAELGRQSLIIDLDMTAGATKSLRAPTEGWVDTFDLLTGADPEDCIITETEEEIRLPKGIHLVPSSEKLADLENWLGRPENQFVVLQDLLLRPIEGLRGRYDYIWLDTPPQYTKTMIPALKAAEYAILSAMPDQLAVQAIGPAVRYILTAQRGPNPNLVFLGVIMNAMPRPMTRLATSLVAEVEKAAPGLQFKADLQRTVVLQEATKAGQTIVEYQPDHPIAESYRALAREVESRIRDIERVAQTPMPNLEAAAGAPPPAGEER